ncbi:MAG: hypothetical protein MJ214_04145 [Bacilli bacterium]|nr:hypothetical protein [Bacilli bacterium]
MKDKTKECLELAEEIISHFELSDLPAENIILKCLRLCRLLNDDYGVKLFEYESSGYPSSPDGIPCDVFNNYCRAAGRIFELKENNVNEERANTKILPLLDQEFLALKLALENSRDPNISISSSNPNQYVSNPMGNWAQRNSIVSQISENRQTYYKVRGKLYGYILNKRNSLIYSNIVENNFSRYKSIVDTELTSYCPEALKKFISSYDNLTSSNEEDWANAVHSCRRIIKDLADKLNPASQEDSKLSDEKYINRLIHFISKQCDSKTYCNLIGATLENIGKRIDAIYDASNKGTHENVTKDEAERIIIYTYLLVGDILLIVKNKKK